MIIYSIISEYDIFRQPFGFSPAKKAKEPKNIVSVVTDPKKFINKKSRVN